MTNTRRDFLQALAAASVMAASAGSARTANGSEAGIGAESKPDHDMSAMPASWMGSDKIAMLLYPGFTALDLVGPQYMLGNLMGATLQLVARTRDPVMSDTQLAILPSATLDECVEDLDVLFVPGGSAGTLDAMEDETLVDFIADRGGRAKLVASVCTGSLLLGQAGLLKGYRATSHWVARDVLKAFGAIPVDARVVTDRNRVTGAGVSAGLDLGLSLIARLRDGAFAQAVQLLAEYAPQPPFAAGTPDTAPPEATKMIGGMFEGFVARAHRLAETGR
jgi:putative intracellular protease/amidase